jgi:OmpA-OmpF porin, OOP family
MRGAVASIIVAFLVSTAAALSPSTLMVFFSHGSAELTSEGDKPIEAAAAAYRKRSQSRIVIEAHTDGAEARSASSDLSPARATTVKRRLIEFGVPADRIEVKAYADSRLLVQHPPGAVEPQNRRVELIVY